jgi:tRNA 2-thiouridine synthesizing protein E
MKVPGGRLSDDHWRIIKYLRQHHAKTGEVPTVYRTCEDNNVELDQLEQLFPDGYHRGLVKIAGLRVR